MHVIAIKIYNFPEQIRGFSLQLLKTIQMLMKKYFYSIDELLEWFYKIVTVTNSIVFILFMF